MLPSDNFLRSSKPASDTRLLQIKLQQLLGFIQELCLASFSLFPLYIFTVFGLDDSRSESKQQGKSSHDSTADLQGILQQRPQSAEAPESAFAEADPDQDPAGSTPGPSSALEPLHAGLQRHFDSIQSISDSTTLPQALRDLQRHVARLTGVHQLLDLLRSGHPFNKYFMMS